MPTRCFKRIRQVPGIADLRIQQVFNYPQINIDVDRTMAADVGLTQRDVANSLLVTLSGSGQVKPNFWLNPENGVSYPIVAQMPQYRVNSISDLSNIPITTQENGAVAQRYLGGLGEDHPGAEPGRRVALQRAAGDRHLRRYAGARPRRRLRRHFENPRRDQEGSAARLLRRRARSGPDHE